jgi:biopolymer transport protein ExbD
MGGRYFPAGKDAFQQTFRPQMTSLIDILTLLVVFLIQSFSAEGTLITPSEDLELPASFSKEQPKPSLMIEITRNEVISEGMHVASHASFEKSQGMTIDSLFQWMLIKKKAVADTARDIEVIIQCDRQVPFSVVKKVMFTCSKSGFNDFSVLTIQKD